MKNIKRLIAAVLAIMICLSFAACNKKAEEPNNDTEIESKDPQQELEAVVEHTNILTITNDDKKDVSLGNTKEDVIKAFGEPVDVKNYSLHYEGATVYLSETVNMITINGEGYTGYGKAEIGKSIDEFKKNIKSDEYFAEEQKDIGFYRMTFAVDENGDIIKNPDESHSVTAPYQYIITSNNYGSESTITHIQLKDNRNKE